MAKNTVAERWRQAATKEDCKKLLEDIDNLSYEDFKLKYNFAKTTNKAFAEENIGVKKSVENKNGDKVFQIIEIDKNIEYMQKSIELSKKNIDAVERIKEKYKQYTKRDIYNKLLEDAIKMYGFDKDK